MASPARCEPRARGAIRHAPDSDALPARIPALCRPTERMLHPSDDEDARRNGSRARLDRTVLRAAHRTRGVGEAGCRGPARGSDRHTTVPAPIKALRRRCLAWLVLARHGVLHRNPRALWGRAALRGSWQAARRRLDSCLYCRRVRIRRRLSGRPALSLRHRRRRDKPVRARQLPNRHGLPVRRVRRRGPQTVAGVAAPSELSRNVLPLTARCMSRRRRVQRRCVRVCR